MAYKARHRKQSRLWIKRFSLQQILICVFAAIFIVSAFMVTKRLIQEHNDKAAFDELIQFIEESEIPEGNDDPDTPDPKYSTYDSPTLAKYALLHENNDDFFGWISVEGTKINYPVMYTPDDPEHYLKRAFDGKYSESGVPFIDGKCPKDGHFYLIYGHHMKNKTMFGELPYYEKKSFFDEHPVIRFNTLHEEREYEVVAAFYSQIYAVDATGVFRYYRYTDLSDEAVFDEYMTQVKKAALYDTGVEAEYGDNVIALSTCAYHTENGRFVVVAREKKKS